MSIDSRFRERRISARRPLKSFKRRIRLRRRLCYTVTDARNDDRTAEIGAGGTGIGKVGAGNETADDIALACNEEGRLGDRHP